MPNDCSNCVCPEELRKIEKIIDVAEGHEETTSVEYTNVLNALKEALVSLVDERNRELAMFVVDCVFKCTEGRLNECPTSPNYNNVINAIRNACQAARSSAGDRAFTSSLLSNLKRLTRDQNIRNTLRNVSWLLDTCYDDSRAERLLDALERIQSRLPDNRSRCGALLMLAAAYCKMIKDPSSIERVEWYPYLLRGVALAGTRGRERPILPVCPGRGDLAALAYYIATRCRGVDAINVNVPELLNRLLTPSEAGDTGDRREE